RRHPADVAVAVLDRARAARSLAFHWSRSSPSSASLCEPPQVLCGLGPPGGPRAAQTLLVLAYRRLGARDVAGGGEQQRPGPLVDLREALVLGEADGEGLGVVRVEAPPQLVAGVQRTPDRPQRQRDLVAQRNRLLVELGEQPPGLLPVGR